MTVVTVIPYYKTHLCILAQRFGHWEKGVGQGAADEASQQTAPHMGFGKQQIRLVYANISKGQDCATEMTSMCTLKDVTCELFGSVIV